MYNKSKGSSVKYYKSRHYKYIIGKKDKNNLIRTYILTLIPFDNNKTYQKLPKDFIKDFSGLVTIFNFANTFNYGFRIENGLINGKIGSVSQDNTKLKDYINESNSKTEDASRCETYIVERFYQYCYWTYSQNPYNDAPIYCDSYVWSLITDIFTVCPWAPPGGNGDGGGVPGGNGDPLNPKDNNPDIITTDPSFLNTKAECTYNKLNSSGPIVKNLLSEYFGNSSLDLTFKVNYNLPWGTSADEKVNGICTYNSNNGVTIEINGNYMEQATSIELARTLLHEACHAEIYGRIKKNGGLANMVSSEDLTDEMISLYNSLYCDQYQHEFIADNYRQYIIDGLELVHPCLDSESVLNLLRNSTQYTLIDLYEALSWIGLQKTSSWNNKTSAEKQVITDDLVNLGIMSKECNNEEITFY